MKYKGNSAKKDFARRILAIILVLALMPSSLGMKSVADDEEAFEDDAAYAEEISAEAEDEEDLAEETEEDSTDAEESDASEEEQAEADAEEAEAEDADSKDEDSDSEDADAVSDSEDEELDSEDAESNADDEAVLESGVVLSQHQDEDENTFVDIELTIQETASVDAEDILIKMILPAELSITENVLDELDEDENVIYIESVADEILAEREAEENGEEYEALLPELEDYDDSELEDFGSAVIWSNQTVAANDSGTYMLTAGADDYDFENVGLFYVNGELVDEDDIEIVSEEEETKTVNSLSVAAALEEEEEVAAAAESASALKAYADELFDNYGLKVTVTQSPSGGNTIEAGKSVTWYVTITIPTAENYSGFSAYNKTLWNSYDNLTVTFTAPDGITISDVAAAGYTFENSGDSVKVNLGDVSANSQTISFTVTGYVDADPAPATGTTYTLTGDDVIYSTSITVVDRDNSNEEVETYEVNGTTSTDLSGFTLTSTTEDKWALTKTQDSCVVNENDQLVVTYTIELLMNDYTQLSQYATDGRVNFKSFSIVDTPTITDGTSTYYPNSVTVVNNTTYKETTGTTYVKIEDYATAGDVGLTKTSAHGIDLDSDVPVYTSYTVTVVYDNADQFDSNFYDITTYTLNNTAVLDYTLEYAEDTTPVTGTDTKTVDSAYSNWADAATIDLEKYINSIYGGGNYVTGTSLDSEYTGTVTFTINDIDGAASLYVLIDGKYVAISNLITITRDSEGAALYVTLATGGTQSYSGLLYVNAGTYYIAEIGNTIQNTSLSEFTADSGTALSEFGDSYSFTLTAGQAATINAYNTETRGSISFYKNATNYSGTSTTGALAGAVFTLYSDENCTKPVTDSSGNAITATSDSSGVVTFAKLAVGTYYIKETSAPDGYLPDNTVYTAVVTANKAAAISSNDNTVKNKQNSATLTFEKYLLSTDANGNVVQVAVDSTRLLTVFNSGKVFELQQSSDGTNWTTIRSTEYNTIYLEQNTNSGNVTISAAVLTSLPVYVDSTMTTLCQYRIVENLPNGYSLVKLFNDDITATVNENTVITSSFTLENGDTTVSLTNQTTGEVSVYKQYVLAGTDGATTNAATTNTAATVYLLKASGSSYEVVGTATTGADGNATITGVNILSDSNSAQEYYWAEAVSNSAYSSYALENGSSITVSVNGTDTDMYLLGTATYATAYESINSKTTLTNILPYVRVKLYKEDTSGSYVSGAGYTVYRVENGTEVLYNTDSLAQNTSGTVASGGSTLVLEAGYVYHVYETTVPDNYTGLTNPDGTTDGIGAYITIDLTNAVPDEQGDEGVKQYTYAEKKTFIDKQFPTMKLTKQKVTVSGTPVSYNATFAIYRSATQDGNYTLYKSSYTANNTVYLEPGYYYAFAENVADGYIKPEVYPGTSASVSGAKLTEINTPDGTVYAYVTNTTIEADETYTIGPIVNYSNSSSVTVTKYAYGDSSGAVLSGATIGIYSDADCTTSVDKATTGSDGTVTFSGLKVYDDDGNLIPYYIKEISAPDGYFESTTVLEVTLTAGAVTTTDTNSKALEIYDEPELTVNVPVVWIDYDLDATPMPSYSLTGATVYLYEVVYDVNGNIDHYEYVSTSTSVLSSDENAYATFTGLKHNKDYVFVLGVSGVTDEDAENYPLYASTDYSADYVGADAPGKLTVDGLKSYQYITYNNPTVTERTATADTLENYLLHLEIDILKYCMTNHGISREVTITLADGSTTTAYYVNGALFYLYRQKLTDEELQALADGKEIELTYDATALELVSSDTSSGSGTASLEDVYDDTYVYWLVEAGTGTGHTWPYTVDANDKKTYATYYRILLYPEVLEANYGTITATNATGVQSFDPTDVTKLEVENSCGSGSHQYMISTVFMNKWKGYYDVYGEDTKDYSPFSGVTFQYSLSGTSNSFVIDGANAQTTAGNIAIQYGEAADGDGNTQAKNDAGQVKTLFQLALILNQWYVAIANAAGLSGVTYITDITSSSKNLSDLEDYDGWSEWAGMLYVASSADAASMDVLTDLTANNGEAAKRILKAFAAAYGSYNIDPNASDVYGTYVGYMENVLCEYNLPDSVSSIDEAKLYSTYKYYSYYAHIVIAETDNGNYGDLSSTYEVYLQFRPTGGSGLANIKYFYLDNVDRPDYYYDSDPASVDTMGLDAALTNTTREQIVNMPTLNYSLTVTKYGYELTSSTIGKTDDELDTYFNNGTSTSLTPLASTFALQRYDTSGDTPVWRYYSATSKAYVTSPDDAQFTTDSITGQFTISLPLGYYRLIEQSVATGYEVVLDGTDVTAKDSTTTEAVRYFWITSADNGENTVNIYDPQSADLYIEKYTLSGTQIKGGLTFTLTASDGTEHTGSWDSATSSYKINNLPAGTYIVTESVTGSNVTGDYFQSFTITISYGRSAKAGTAEQDSSVTEYDTYVTGVSASIDGQVKCSVSGCEDSIRVSDDYTYATLTVHNPSTGSLTVTKTDSSTGDTVTSGSMKFKLYYTPFTSSDLDSTDKYVVSKSATAPTFDPDNWTLVQTYSTTNGIKTLSGLTPGWYAVVETEAPSGYELNENVKRVKVTADMTADHTLQNSNGNVTVTVADTKKVGLSVTKTFNLEDFNDLLDESNNYSVTYGLYVYDTTSKSYVPAYDLGLTTTSGNVTVTVNNTSGSVTTTTGTWANLIQMESQLVSGVYTVTDGTKTYTLDGSYYIKEEAVTYTNPNTRETKNISSDWWTSGAKMTSDSSSGMSVTEQSNGYYKITGFTGNATGTVSFTNDLTYATVTIQKIDDSSAANPLKGATFTVYSDSACTTAVASGTTGESGTVTITVPVSNTAAQTFYIKETTAPDGYALYEGTIEVSLASGSKVSYTNTNDLTIKDSNGVYVKLTKYDNIHSCVDAAPLSGVTFTLLRSTDNGRTWTVQRTYTTDSSGGINFGTLVNSENTKYMLVETGYNTTLYDGMESMWYTLTTYDEDTGTSETTAEQTITATTVVVGDDEYTGYEFSLVGIEAGSLYELYAYNRPRPAVTFVKKGYGSDTAVPTATLEVYKVDASGYNAGQSLTDSEVTAAKNSGTYVTTLTTTEVSGEDYSSVTYNLSAGTYLVVETSASGGNYIINKDDSHEVWYQIIEVPSNGTTEMTVDSFVNVTQSYAVAIKKTGTSSLENDILTSSANLTYSLAVGVTNSGPISGLTVTDSGLLVTKVWSGVGSSATEVGVDTDEQDDYLDGEYTITSVTIPTDASYTYDSLVFTTGDKSAFTPSITAKVTFTYSDDTTEEQTAVLSNMSDSYWTVTPNNSNLKAVSFTVTWYDENLETYTGYELGSSFTVSESGSEIGVNMKIDQQNGGTEAYYAVAEIRNSSSVVYDYSSWNTSGTKTEDKKTASSYQNTTVPNVTAPVLTVTKKVENETTGGTTAVIGNKLKYTITVTNSSGSLNMDNPIILDLLPQGLVAVSAADENSFYGNVTIASSTNADSTLKIENVYHATSDGYTLLQIVTSGSLAKGETVTITLEATVDSTILNYLSSGSSITNNVWVTSATQGTVYHDNTVGSIFMGDTSSWASSYDSTSSLGSILNSLLTSMGVMGYGYISDDTAITYTATSAVNVLKEVQGDQDGTDWYHGDEGGTVTANKTDSDYDDGYARFRLTVTNMNESQALANIVLMDIVPKENGASFNSNIKKDWDLDFDSIESVYIGSTKITADRYTLWYYTETLVSSSDVATMQEEFDKNITGNWVQASSYDGAMSGITAFAVVFDSSVTLSYNEKLQLVYKATVPQMNETEAAAKAHLATYNDFRLLYQMQVGGVTGSEVYTLDSNYVYVLLETEAVGVGGMAWIDADGDGKQDSEDVTPNTYDADTDSGGGKDTAQEYNSRTNNYASYSVVSALLDSITVQLNIYSGSTVSTLKTFNLLNAGKSWRFLFDGLTTANISSAYDDSTAYDDDGILWKALAGSTNATWYQLVTTVAGSDSIKYSLTGATTDMTSYDPADMYDDTVTGVLNDSNFRTSAGESGTDTITTGSTTAYSEKFFLYSGDEWNLAEDIGLVIYRDLTITKNDTNGSSPEAGSTFVVYGPYAKGEASKVTSLDNEKVVATYKTTETNPSTASFTNLLYFQEYIIVETEADSSYELGKAVATGTNITAITDGIKKGETTYTSAWILNIPGASSSTDPAADNTYTTDNMTVTNAKKMTIEFTKVQGDDFDEDNPTSATTLAGAVFELYSANDVNDDGTLKDSATVLCEATSDASGAVKFAEELYDGNGDVSGYNYEILDSGTYYVYETKAPNGYVLPTTNYWKVTVDTANKTVTFESGNTALFYDSQSSGYYILNYKEYNLPMTGGMGTGAFTFVGFALMVGAPVVYYYKRKRYEYE